MLKHLICEGIYRRIDITHKDATNWNIAGKNVSLMVITKAR